MKQKPGVMIYFEMLPVLELLKDEEKGVLFHAIMVYGADGTCPNLSGKLALMWPLIQQRLDRDWDRYRAVVTKRKYAAYTRWEKQHGREPMSYSMWVDERGYDACYEEDLDMQQ